MLVVFEGIAKFPAPEKSMILSQFAGGAERPELRRQGHTRESRTWRRSGKMAQKGDFAGAGSFAIPSVQKKGSKGLSFPVLTRSGTVHIASEFSQISIPSGGMQWAYVAPQYEYALRLKLEKL
jgi:hypothetical protein